MGRVRGCLVGTALALVALTACGDDDSAADQVCDSRTELRQAVDTVQQDIGEGNFGQARDDLPAVEDAYETLRQDLADLADQESQELQPDIDALTTTFASLSDVQSLGELEPILATLGSQLDSIYAQITDTLDCS